MSVGETAHDVLVLSRILISLFKCLREPLLVREPPSVACIFFHHFCCLADKPVISTVCLTSQMGKAQLWPNPRGTCVYLF